MFNVLRIPTSFINGCMNPVRCFGTFSPINKNLNKSSGGEVNFDDVPIKPPDMQPTKSVSEYFNQQVKEGKFKMKTSLTLKSVLFLVLIAVAKTVLSLFFDEPTTTKIIEILQNVLNSLFGVGVAGALWGIRRKISDY